MSLPQPSRLPSVVEAVVGLARAAREAGVVENVLYGPTPKGATRGTTLAVFVGSPGANVRPEVMQGFDGVTYAEVVEVNCNAVAWSGSSTIEQHLGDVYAILGDLRERIDADPTLGEVCEQATLGAVESAFPVSDKQGSSVELAFTVRALSYI